MLIVLTGLIPALGDLIARIPTSLARAMLAGVLLPICLEPVTGLADSPAYVGPVVLAWLVMHRISRRWAVPVSLAVALVVVVVSAGVSVAAGDLVPTLTWTTPHWTVAAVVSIAIPLYIVTMASQNVPGVAVMSSYGYQVPWRETMTVTGIGTLLGAPFGGHAINLAAITAAMTAGPMAGADRSRRWIAAVSAAATYLVLALACGALTALVAAAPGDVMQAAAGLALLGTLAASLAGALADEDGREAAVVCFVVAASGVSILGVGAAFWALLAGLVLRPLLRPAAQRGATLKVSQVERSPSTERNVSPLTTTRPAVPVSVIERTRPPQSPLPSRPVTAIRVRSPIAGQARSRAASSSAASSRARGCPTSRRTGPRGPAGRTPTPAEVQPPLLEPNWVNAGSPPLVRICPRVAAIARLEAGCSASYPP